MICRMWEIRRNPDGAFVIKLIVYTTEKGPVPDGCQSFLVIRKSFPISLELDELLLLGASAYEIQEL